MTPFDVLKQHTCKRCAQPFASYSRNVEFCEKCRPIHKVEMARKRREKNRRVA